jgi:hypothetical protein
MRKILSLAVLLGIGSLSFGADMNITNVSTTFSGTEFVVSTAGTGQGLLLSKIVGSVGTVRTLQITFYGLSSTATGKAAIGGTAATLKQGKGKGCIASTPRITWDWIKIGSANSTTSVYLECSDSNVNVSISAEGR